MTLSTEEAPANPGLDQPRRSSPQRQRTVVKSTNQVSSRIQYIFFVAILFIIMILVPFTVESFKSTQYYVKHKPEGYRWPHVADFWFTGVTTLLFMALERLFEFTFTPCFYNMCKEKNNEAIRKLRTKKAVFCLFKCFFQLNSVILGWYTLKDSYVLPPSLGGSGDFYNIFIDFPYIEQSSLYRFYFTGTLGYFTGTLINRVFAKEKQPDYIETMLHHLVTIYLYVFSYMTNLLVGGVVTYLHSLADLALSFSRVFAETTHKNIALVGFIFAQIIWIYTRIIVFPYMIYVTTFDLEVFCSSPYIQPTFGLLMICLFFLHIYWIYIMLKMLVNAIVKNEVEDLRDKPQAVKREKRGANTNNLEPKFKED